MRRLQDPIDVERLLAVSRLALASACLVSASSAAGPFVPVGTLTALFLGYTVFSVAILLLDRFDWLRWTTPLSVHLVDCAWACGITLVSDDTGGPFVLLLVFTVLSAAFRWRLSETLFTGAAAVAAMVINARIFGIGQSLAPRIAGVAVAALLIGLLAEYEKSRREQGAILSDLLAGVQSQRGFRLALKFIAEAMLRLTGSSLFLIAARELDSNRGLLWTATRAASGAILLTSTELPFERRDLYFFHATGDAWAIVRRRRGTCTMTAIDRQGDTIPGAACEVGGAFWQYHQHHAALAVSVTFGGAWRGRVILLRQRRYSLWELRFIHRVVCQLLPPLHNQYLWRRLRSRAAAAERRRVARELHDGVIQSLVGLEMQTASVRREVGDRDPAVDHHLARIQQLLGDEARAVRDVMQSIRPFEAGPGQFVPALAEMVERFGRDAGITAKFYAGPQDVYVPPGAARELARTLQEALTNVRRHAGARKVEVEFRADADAWRLDVENDGRPFGFLGRLSLDELEARRLGPRVIKERVRDMGGDLNIESTETAGVRLEISLPRPEGQSKSA